MGEVIVNKCLVVTLIAISFVFDMHKAPKSVLFSDWIGLNCL